MIRLRGNVPRWFLPAAILLLAAAFRLIALHAHPIGFFRDEADKGYTSLCLWLTGQDQAGAFLPLFVRSLQVTTSALYQYINIPFIALFGLHEWVVRLPAALAGTGSVIAVYYLARRWWGKTPALWTAAFLAVSPWSLLLSRWANQSILLTLWIPLAVYFLAAKEDRPLPSWADTAWGCLFLLLALYTYAPARLFIPVFAALLAAILLYHAWREHAPSKAMIRFMALYAAILALGALPLAWHIIAQPEASSARLARITIFDGQPLVMVGLEWVRNYFLHFSLNFLFVSGDANPRHSIEGFGQLHMYLLPLIVVGIMGALRKRARSDWLLLAWLLCFPIAAACTRESIPHALRSVFAIPLMQLLAARGLITLHHFASNPPAWLKHSAIKITSAVWVGIAILSVLVFLGQLYVRYPIASALDWEAGWREAVGWWKENHAPYERTVVTGIAAYPEVFFLFYGDIEPAEWIEKQEVPGVQFLQTGLPAQSAFRFEGPPTLYLVRPDELSNLQPLEVVHLPSGQAVWKWCRGGEKPASPDENSVKTGPSD